MSGINPCIMLLFVIWCIYQVCYKEHKKVSVEVQYFRLFIVTAIIAWPLCYWGYKDFFDPDLKQSGNMETIGFVFFYGLLCIAPFICPIVGMLVGNGMSKAIDKIVGMFMK